MSINMKLVAKTLDGDTVFYAELSREETKKIWDHFYIDPDAYLDGTGSICRDTLADIVIPSLRGVNVKMVSCFLTFIEHTYSSVSIYWS